jgi:hypothetical protein
MSLTAAEQGRPSEQLGANYRLAGPGPDDVPAHLGFTAQQPPYSVRDDAPQVKFRPSLAGAVIVMPSPGTANPVGASGTKTRRDPPKRADPRLGRTT